MFFVRSSCGSEMVPLLAWSEEALTVICINLTAASADAGDQWRNEKGSKESFFGPVQVVLYLVLTYKFSSTITHSPQMSSVVNISIVNHTTSSTPSPHVLYVVNVTFDDGQQNKVLRRYSQFVTLHECLRDSFALPPRRALANVVVPSAWIDDQLICERKAGLADYLNQLIAVPEFQDNQVILQFLTSPLFDPAPFLDTLNDLPCMVSKSTLTADQTKIEPDDPRSTPVAATYYPAWAIDHHPPEGLDFSKFNIIFFASVTPDSTSTINWDAGSQDALWRLVTAARKSRKEMKIVLSIGGWGGSYWFSHATSNDFNRTKLTNALVSAVHTFGLDGVDIDWEYPNSSGAGNPHSSQDAANFLIFLKLLRTSLGPSKIISSAVTHMPWLGENGQPLPNVSAYAAQMTYVNIMNYDVFSASSNPGPNAPLGNLCGTSSQPSASACAAFAQWTRAGMPASKLLLGLPLYGHVSKSSKNKLSGSSVHNTAVGAGHPRARICGAQTGKNAPVGDLSGMWGKQIAFGQLLNMGALKSKGDGTYVGANGYTMAWDDCSDTPFLYNQARTTVVSYDDTWSLAEKVKFAKKSGMAGCFTWSVDQDDGMALQDVVRKNLGKE